MTKATNLSLCRTVSLYWKHERLENVYCYLAYDPIDGGCCDVLVNLLYTVAFEVS